MKNRQYHGVQLSKKESELVEFLQTGSNDYRKAFWIYPSRRNVQTIRTNTLKEKSWFNTTLRKLKDKGLMMHIPFVIGNFKWMNPGVEASKANLVIEEKIQQYHELKAPTKII